jgi:hypothetical protein
MSNSCLDTTPEATSKRGLASMLADPFRRRLLSATAISAACGALAAAGVPLPLTATNYVTLTNKQTTVLITRQNEKLSRP